MKINLILFGSFKINPYLCSIKRIITAPRVAQNRLNMNKKNIVTALMTIAAANADGFTVTAKTLQPITRGYAVAFAETQNSFEAAGLDRVIKFASENAEVNAFGGWLNSENKRFYFDAVAVVEDLQTAYILARRNKQIALFDLKNGVEIRL